MSEYKKKLYKLPRLYINTHINLGQVIELEQSHAHYLKNVIRKNIGDYIRVFNGSDGEWICKIEKINKKSCFLLIEEMIRAQSDIGNRKIHLFFAPIKKNRMDWMIEKSVELGVTDFHPIITQNTENRKFNIERINKQIIEAAEQCERLDIATFHNPDSLMKVINSYNNIDILFAVERVDVDNMHNVILSMSDISEIGYMTGPEGGWSKEEIEWLFNKDNVKAVSLGNNILRAETAVLYGLSLLMM